LIHRLRLIILTLTIICFLMSCAHVSKQMPGELEKMHNFLTQDEPNTCQRYHYNFKRQAPRLYSLHHRDSIFKIIEYIKTECGSKSDLDVTRMLLLSDNGRYDDSLIGSDFIPHMLWFRSEHEYLVNREQWEYLYGSSHPIDNTYDNFNQFISGLANEISLQSDNMSTVQTLGLFYSGQFDSAFSQLQSDDLYDSKLRRKYDGYVNSAKLKFPTRGNTAFLLGGWNPQGKNRFLGSHPEIGLQIGGESKIWRLDGIISYRFTSAKNEYLVDSLGKSVPTKKFQSWLFGVDGGLKVFDNSIFSTDIFVGVGYDEIKSIKVANDTEEPIIHGSFAASIGLRQRIFLNRRTGMYIGGVVRYNFVDYGNPGGTDLSGNTLSISLLIGWSFHETLNQFLKKLNYKGSWRP